MTAKRLPSGNYRVQVYSHKDADGKNVYESFTAPTKREAEAKAIAFQQKRTRIKNKDLTIGEAVRRYIEVNDGTLSESTIAAYTRYLTAIKEIDHIPLSKLSQDELQAHVSRMARTRSPKTVRNVMGLVNASVRMFRPDIELRYNLPMYVRKKVRVPNDDEIAQLMQVASDTMKLCIALGCCSLRRGEMCSVKLKDIQKIDDNRYALHVHGDCVKDKNGKWVHRDKPKTPESDRIVQIPQAIFDLIKVTDPEDYIIDIVPNTISDTFLRLCKRYNFDMTFHTTRHYYASLMAYLGVPDFATAEMGGWKHVDKVMKEIYQGVSEERRRQYMAAGTDHLDGLFSKK